MEIKKEIFLDTNTLFEEIMSALLDNEIGKTIDSLLDKPNNMTMEVS